MTWTRRQRLWWRLTLPFHRAYWTLHRAWLATRPGYSVVSDEQLEELTSELDRHPDGWEHPCMCALCRSYCD